eukprot:6181898-Pleurochrysis_carterae.AAC.3
MGPELVTGQQPCPPPRLKQEKHIIHRQELKVAMAAVRRTSARDQASNFFRHKTRAARYAGPVAQQKPYDAQSGGRRPSPLSARKQQCLLLTGTAAASVASAASAAFTASSPPLLSAELRRLPPSRPRTRAAAQSGGCGSDGSEKAEASRAHSRSVS